MTPSRMEHIVVYRDDGCFAAWPFNGGFWGFAGDEFVVGFVRGRCDYRTPLSTHHGVVDQERGEHVVLRSTDGGRRWPEEGLSVVYTRPALDFQLKHMRASRVSELAHDPRAEGFCLLSGYGMPPNDAPDVIFAMVSADRGRTWNAPVRLPPCGFLSLGGRPSYVVREDGTLLLFGHGNRAREDEVGVPAQAVPVVYASSDGGASWGMLTEMDLTPRRPLGIMPYPILLDDGRIVAAVRRQYDSYSAYTQVYRSSDGGRSWSFLSRVNDWGAPASLTQLPDGRVVCVYGYRRRPFGIRARVSADRCATWGREIVLRDDGGSWDLGYPRTLLRSDGALVTVYYFNDRADPIQQDGGVRYIAATIWRA